MPVSGATIFINGTTKYCISNDSGKFKIENVKDERFEIVCTLKGYTTLNYLYKKAPKNYAVRFEINPIQNIVGIVIGNGREYLEKTFLNSLLGIVEARNCEVANMNALTFLKPKSVNEIHVSLTEPLIIFNEHLGYMIHVAFNDISITNIQDQQNEMFTWFKPLTSKSSDKIDKWQKAREEVYENSLLRFMRAVYADNLMQRGFQTRFITRIYSNDSAYNHTGVLMKKTNTMLSDAGIIFPDTNRRYIDLLDKKPIPTSNYRIDEEGNEISIQLNNQILQVIRLENANEYSDYKMLPVKEKFNAFYLSTIDNQKIFIEPSGAFYNASDLLVSRLWSHRSLGSKLPVDWIPGVF
ncbi:hypothetical protein GALL_167550 [mine drainage metagenome]|uniref:Carboxypeptidase-like regulatory domain-containing protein n=1 Tax=mine drainage metagenome TaxID=410659 RepID=A0A1J5RZ36_9ZZZZ